MEYCSVINTPHYFGNCLAGLRVTELMLLKKSLKKISILSQENGSFSNTDLTTISPSDSTITNYVHGPQHMALMSAEHGYNTHYYQPYQQTHKSQSWHTALEEKPSKLQTIFQISITALAFLSFGGYLLCLIVQSIKSKGTTYFHPVATANTPTINGDVKRIKIYRRSRRSNSAIKSHIFKYNYLVGSYI